MSERPTAADTPIQNERPRRERGRHDKDRLVYDGELITHAKLKGVQVRFTLPFYTEESPEESFIQGYIESVDKFQIKVVRPDEGPIWVAKAYIALTEILDGEVEDQNVS